MPRPRVLGQHTINNIATIPETLFDDVELQSLNLANNPLVCPLPRICEERFVRCDQCGPAGDDDALRGAE